MRYVRVIDGVPRTDAARAIPSLREALRQAQCDAGLHLTVLPVDIHFRVGQCLLGERGGPRAFAAALPALRTFCSEEALAQLWASLGFAVSYARFGVQYAAVRAQAQRFVNEAQRLLGDVSAPWASHLMVCASCPENARRFCECTDGGDLIVWHYRPLSLEALLVEPRPVELRAHRCMLKKDARLRFGTYAPYARQDFISVNWGGREMNIYVVNADAFLTQALV